MVGKNYVLLTETLKRILHSENDRYSRTYWKYHPNGW
jgi:hypothetical protein